MRKVAACSLGALTLVGIMSIGCGASERGSRNDAGAGVAGASGWSTGGASGLGGMGNGGGGAPQPAPVPETEVGKEFLINDSNAVQAPDFYLRVVSTTEAEVTPPFGAPNTMPIAHVPGALVRVSEPQIPGVPGKLTGSYVVGDEPPASLTNYEGMFALSESPTGGIGGGGLYLLPGPVHGCRQEASWYTSDCTVEVDDTPTEVIASAESQLDSAVLPWESVRLTSSKPAMLPLSDALTATLGGDPAKLTWTFSSTSRATFMLSDWAKAVGRSLTLSGSVASTNGVPSPITLDVPVVDFGPVRGQKLDFSADLPSDLGVPAGSVTHLAPGANDACPGGCAMLSTGTTLVARLAGTGATVRLKAAVVPAMPNGGTFTGSFDVQLVREGAESVDDPSLLMQPASPQSPTTSYDLPAGAGTGDLFVVISVPQGYFRPDACASLFDIDLFLESIELIEM
jgi:hypothetical protein